MTVGMTPFWKCPLAVNAGGKTLDWIHIKEKNKQTQDCVCFSVFSKHLRTAKTCKIMPYSEKSYLLSGES